MDFNVSFGTNIDLSLQLRNLIFLSDDRGSVQVLDYCSKKSKRVVCSIMAAEAFALDEAFDAAFVIANDLQTIHNSVIPLDLFTESKQVFDAVSKGRKMSEEKTYD